MSRLFWRRDPFWESVPLKNPEKRFLGREDTSDREKTEQYRKILKPNEDVKKYIPSRSISDDLCLESSISQLEIRFLRRKAIPSFGIILYSYVKNKDGQKTIKYLLGQKRDSISYQEFLRDNLPEENIKKHISLMSKEEKKRILTYDFEELWKDLWLNHKSKHFKFEYNKAHISFIRKLEIYRMEFKNQNTGIEENSWCPPKGRKYIFESEEDCALRETNEEINVDQRDITLSSNLSDNIGENRDFIISEDLKRELVRGGTSVHGIDSYEEFYIGTDNNLYRNVYFIGFIPYKKYKTFQYKSINSSIRPKTISSEMEDMKWFSYFDAMKKLDSSKQCIFRDINNRLLFENRITKRKIRRNSI